MFSLLNASWQRIAVKILIGVWMAFAVAYFIISITYLLHMGLHPNAHKLRYDFGYYDYAFRVVWGHQPSVNMYDVSKQIAWMRSLGFSPSPFDQYVYPPQFAVLFAWLAPMPFHTASTVWAVLCIAAYLVATYYTVQFAGARQPLYTRMSWFGLALFSMPFLNDFFVCNVNSIVYLCIVLTLILVYRNRHYRWAGVILGISIMIKVTPIYLLAYMAFQRKWTTVVSTILTGVIGTAITVYFLGPSLILWYIRQFTHLSATSMKNGPAPYNSSILGAVAKMVQPGHLSALPHLVYVIYVLILALTFYLTAKYCCTDGRHHAALAALSCVCFSPLIEVTHMVVLLLPAYLALTILPRHLPKGLTLICFVLCALACICFTPLGNAFMQTPYRYFIGLHAVIVLVLLVLWTNRVHARPDDTIPPFPSKIVV